MSDAYSEQLEIYATSVLNPKQTPIYEYVPFELKMPLFDELTAFIQFLEGGIAPKSSAAEGKMVVETIEKLKTMSQQK